MPAVDNVFSAIANRHRRRLLDLLLDQPQPVGDLARPFDLCRPSVSEHLKVLKDAGLVSEERNGRQRIYKVESQGLRPVAEWVSPYEVFWRQTLKDIHKHLLENP